jgi:Ubiquitin carboxyl-terminal hydrolase
MEDCLPEEEWRLRRRRRFHPTMIRGIRNITGTACHFNAALALLAYGLDAIPEFLIAYEPAQAQRDQEPFLWRALVTTLVDHLRRPEGTDVAAVDPTELFDALKNEPNAPCHRSPEQCGDAVVALLRCLQLLRRADGTELLDRVLYAGRWHSVLHGTVVTDDAGERGSNRRRVLKERTLMNPFPVPTCSRAIKERVAENRKRFTSLAEALQYAFLEEQAVEGYQWPDDDSLPKGLVTTTKRCHVTRLPPIFLIHLQGRHRHAPESMCVDGKDSMEIPTFLDGSDYLSSSEEDASIINTSASSASRLFHLRGGILHICHRGACGEELGDDSIGHYVVIVSTTPIGTDLPEWYLIDDENVISVSLKQVLLWMAGDWYTPDFKDDLDAKDELYARAILLVYHREDLPDIVDSLSLSLFHQTTANLRCSPTNESSAYSQNGSSSKGFVRTGQTVSVFGDSSWDPGNDFSSIDNTTVRRVGVSTPEQFCAPGVRRIDPETGQCVVTYEAPSSSRASPVLQKSVEWRKNNYVNKETASSVTLETQVGETNGGHSERSAPREESRVEEQSWTGRRLRVLWSGGIFYEGRITHFDPSTGQHTVAYTDGDIRQYQLSKKTFEWLDEEGKCGSRSTTHPSSAKFSSLWLDDSDVSDNDESDV